MSFVLKWVSCRQHIVGSCFFNPISHSFDWSLYFIGTEGNYERYVFTVILDLIFQSISYFFLVPFTFSFCDLMIFFCIMLIISYFGFSDSLVFLICGYPVFKYVNPFLYILSLDLVKWLTHLLKKNCIFLLSSPTFYDIHVLFYIFVLFLLPFIVVITFTKIFLFLFLIWRLVYLSNLRFSCNFLLSNRLLLFLYL